LASRFGAERALLDSLEEVSKVIREEHEVAPDDAIPVPNLGKVHFTGCDPDGICLAKGNATVFLKNASLAVAPGAVNYTAQSTVLDIWLGALAANLMTGGKSRASAFRDIEQLRLRITEDYRLDDPAANEGYYKWPDFCANSPVASASPGSSSATLRAPQEIKPVRP